VPIVLPVPNPSTWIPGDHITSGRLRTDVSGAVDFHTRRPYYQSLQSYGLNQSIPTSSWTGVTLDTVWADTAGGHSATNQSRYICQVAGWYLASGSVAYTASATALSNTYIVGMRVNGLNDAAHLFEGAKQPGANSHTIVPLVVELIKLNVGDYVELATFQNSGAAATLADNNAGTPPIYYMPNLTLTWVAATSGTVGLPVPNPSSWTDGTVITAATLNTQVRDTVRFLTYPPIARLFYTGTTPAGQTLANSIWATHSWDSATVDNYTGWGGTGTNPTRYTAPVAGHYLIATQSSTTGPFTGKRGAGIRVNGTTDHYGGYFAALAAAGHSQSGLAATTVRLLKLNAADYVETIGFQNQGSVNALSTSTSMCKLIVVWMCS
jgi:hypothetical protein